MYELNHYLCSLNHPNRMKKHRLTINIIAILVVLTVGYVAISLLLRSITRHNHTYVLPDFYGMSIEEAKAASAEGNFRLEVTDSVYIRGMERGTISKQNPAPGSKVKRDRRVLLVINSVLPKQVEVPSLTGFSLRQAKTELSSAGLRLGRLIYTEDMATNNVLSQKYKGEDIEPGTSLESESYIDLVLGLNPSDDRTYIPDVIGYRYQIAKDLLHESSLNISKLIFDEEPFSYADTLESFIYSQYPVPSDSTSVKMGSEVTLYLTKDHSKIIIPEPSDSTDHEE